MPHQRILSPDYDPHRSLGWLATAWCEHFVRHGPGAVAGKPVHHGQEYTEFIVGLYAVGDEPEMNYHFIHDTAFLSRPKGCDKSGIAGRLCLFEAFGPARFAGWARGGEVYEDPHGFGFRYEYQPGEPMGQLVESPFIRILATEENQTGNTFRTVLYNLTNDECPLYYWPGHDASKERVFLKGRGSGEIRTSTASAASKDGGLETFCVADETHLYDVPELIDMKETVAQNLEKRKKTTGTLLLETTTMFAPGDESAAEATFKEAEAILEGRKRRGGARLYYDHRFGHVVNLADEQELRAAIVDAYGDALEWISLEGLVNKAYDTRTSPARFRRFFLNAQTSSKDSWIKLEEWDACKRPDLELRDGELVALGMDGSVTDDATCVSAVSITTGHVELLGCWERPPGPAGEDWMVPRDEVDACISDAFRRFQVAAFFADPPHWTDYLAAWTDEYGERLKVKASQKWPIHWWTNRPTQMVEALATFREAVWEKRLSFTPADDRVGKRAELATTLRRHIGNTREKPSRAGLQIGKEHKGSDKKIDGAMSTVLAWTARAACIAAGVKPEGPKQVYLAKRIR
jgi:hypothetical protein